MTMPPCEYECERAARQGAAMAAARDESWPVPALLVLLVCLYTGRPGRMRVWP